MTIVITNSVVAVHCKSDCMHVSLDLAFADRNHIYLMSNEHSLKSHLSHEQRAFAHLPNACAWVYGCFVHRIPNQLNFASPTIRTFYMCDNAHCIDLMCVVYTSLYFKMSNRVVSCSHFSIFRDVKFNI